MLNKIFAIVFIISLLFIITACTGAEVDMSVSYDTGIDSLDSVSNEATAESVDTTANTAESESTNSEIDIISFITLDRHFEEGDSPSVTKDDILKFDNQSRYIGPVPEHSYDYTKFTLFIGSDERTLLGHKGFLYYPAKVDYTDVIENVVEYSHEYYSPCYKYVGDGNDIPFGSDMIFTINDATYNDYVDILGKVAELVGTNKSNIKIIHDLTFKKLEYSRVEDIPNILSIEDYDAVVENEKLKLYSQALYIPDSTNYPFYIKVDWLSEKDFLSDNNMYKEIFPGGDSVSNRIVIRVYRGNSKPEPTVKNSDYYINGTYTCSSDYFGNLFTAPSICFNKDGDCVISVNYSGGICNMEGKYYIQGDKIYVKLSFDNTIFEDTGNEYTDLDYMSDEYVFTIANDNEIVINRGCYAVKAGDSFALVNSTKRA